MGPQSYMLARRETGNRVEMVPSKNFLKLPSPVLPGSGAKGLSQPHCNMPCMPVKHPCFVSDN
jgi:hypothetical protein